jgi:hypothetical protein
MWQNEEAPVISHNSKLKPQNHNLKLKTWLTHPANRKATFAFLVVALSFEL